MRSSTVTKPGSQKSFDPATADFAVRCRGVVKSFYFYDHRTTTLREAFIRTVRRRPLQVGRADFTLRDFSLDVRRGEVVALIGPNGSGKSTALRLMAGIYPPTAGTVETFGKVAAVIELGAGLHPELTGAENIALYGAVMGLTRPQIRERSPEIVAFSELGDFIDVPIKYYSSGMQARLAFSVTICITPEILLVDEVLAVGDASFRARCIDRLRSFVEEGGTLVLVSHDMDTVTEHCSRAVWLDHGRIRMEGPAGEVCEEYLRGGANPGFV